MADRDRLDSHYDGMEKWVNLARCNASPRIVGKLDPDSDYAKRFGTQNAGCEKGRLGMLNDVQWHDAMRRAGLKRELRIATLHENPGSILFNRSIRHWFTEIVVYRYRPRGTLRTNFPLPDVFDSHKIEKTHPK